VDYGVRRVRGGPPDQADGGRLHQQEIEPLEDEHDQFLGEDAEFNIMVGDGQDYRMCEEYLDV
jgi:hypothetical protein